MLIFRGRELKRRGRKKDKKKIGSSLPKEPPLSPLEKGKDVVGHSLLQKKKRRTEDVSVEETLVDQDTIVSNFLANRSFLSDPDDILVETKNFLLPEDKRSISNFGLRTATDRGLITMMQGIQYFMTVAGEAQYRKNLTNSLEKELANAKLEIEKLNVIKEEF